MFQFMQHRFYVDFQTAHLSSLDERAALAFKFAGCGANQSTRSLGDHRLPDCAQGLEWHRDLRTIQVDALRLSGWGDHRQADAGA